MAKLKVKMGAVKKIDENVALNLLRSMSGSMRAALTEVRNELYRQVGAGVKFLQISVSAPDGNPLPEKEIMKLVQLQNTEFSKKGFNFRGRYSPQEKAIIYCPLKNYEELFGKRESRGGR